MYKIRVSAFGFIVLMFAAAVWAAPVPDTTQLKCYNNTVEIPCPSPGQPFYGQDANYNINPLSYTKLDNSGNALADSAVNWSMVRDNVTGLIWESKTDDGTIHNKDDTYTWNDPTDPYPGAPGVGTDTKYFIDALNSARFGGSSEWRMPTVKELGSIIDYSNPGLKSSIATNYFPNTQASSYWSSTAFAYDTSYAWGVDFYNGYGNYNPKNTNNYVRAVRGGQSESFSASSAADGYVDNGDGTVTDISTGLMWQAGISSSMNWEQALAYCEALNLGGYTDWRLPAKKMMRSLVDFSVFGPPINSTYFPDTFVAFYWTATTDFFNADLACGVYFFWGDDGYNSKLESGHVRAVRGGEIPASTVCMATLDDNLLLHIPYFTYIDPILGALSLWADLVYEFNPMYPTLILFKLSNGNIISNPSYLCSASRLTYDLKILIPDVLLSDGTTHLWVNLEYDPALSNDENAYFLVESYAIRTPQPRH